MQAWFDGGARGNPGPAGFGVVLKDGQGKATFRHWGFLEHATNNVAEYHGLIAALEAACLHGAGRLWVFTDSELIQRQITGVYKVRQPHLVPLFEKARQLIGNFKEFRIVHVPRAENREADALANRAMDERASGSEEER